MTHEPHYLSEEEKQKLVIGERLVIGVIDGFAVVSSPGEKGHPVIYPHPRLRIVDPPMHKIFKDRRIH